MAKKIYLSPSDQTSNKYAYGDTNEAVQCRRIADACEVALRRCGFEVRNNQTSSMSARCSESDKWGADLHVPIHTNAHNKSVTGTRMFSYDTSGGGYKACKAIFAHLAPLSPGTSENIQANKSLYEIRVPNASTAYIEVDFHDVDYIAKWIIESVVEIGEAICHGICDYFGVEYVAPAPPKKYAAVLGEYETEDEAKAVIDNLKVELEAVREKMVRIDSLIAEIKVM